MKDLASIVDRRYRRAIRRVDRAEAAYDAGGYDSINPSPSEEFRAGLAFEKYLRSLYGETIAALKVAADLSRRIEHRNREFISPTDAYDGADVIGSLIDRYERIYAADTDIITLTTYKAVADALKAIGYDGSDDDTDDADD